MCRSHPAKMQYERLQQLAIIAEGLEITYWRGAIANVISPYRTAHSIYPGDPQYNDFAKPGGDRGYLGQLRRSPHCDVLILRNVPAIYQCAASIARKDGSSSASPPKFSAVSAAMDSAKGPERAMASLIFAILRNLYRRYAIREARRDRTNTPPCFTASNFIRLIRRFRRRTSSSWRDRREKLAASHC